MKITVEATINAPMEKVWQCWNQPEHIMKWNFASDDWHCPAAEVHLKVGGTFKIAMAAKDNSAGFDFEGKYTTVEPHKLIEYVMDDGRKVTITFEQMGTAVKVSETFDAENVYSGEQQRAGWQAILDNFKKHTESEK